MFGSSYFLHAAALEFVLAVNVANAAAPSDLLAGYVAQAGTSPNPQRGQQLFVNRHGQQWTCASCHGAIPTNRGGHASTGKPIAPLAPGFNPDRFTDVTKT